jgi:hypothetical protein
MCETQRGLPFLTAYHGPEMVDHAIIESLHSYRQAVRYCWFARKRRDLTQVQIAKETGLSVSHVSDYLTAKAKLRDLPARYIMAFEVSCGNTAISQWIAMQAQLPVCERRAA